MFVDSLTVFLIEWKVVLYDLKVCENVKLLRWYGDYRNLEKVELHGFADASLKGVWSLRGCYHSHKLL